MTKTWKALVYGLVLIMVALAPACRTRKTTAPVVQPAATTEAPPPVIPPPPPPPQPVTTAEPTEFVKEEPAVTSTTLPGDLEEANRLAQQRGYLADAFFAYNESTLTSDAQAALTRSADWLKHNAQYSLLIEGHCDERGTEQYNLALGDRRANIAKEYLVTLGVDGGRLRTVSYGEERPFDPGHDDSAWAKNRRAHLVLVGK